MRKYILIVLVIFSSCKTWNEDDKNVYITACMNNARHWAGTEEKARTYCNCVLDKMIEKYPDENDALDHIDDLTRDTALTNCRKLVQ